MLLKAGKKSAATCNGHNKATGNVQGIAGLKMFGACLTIEALMVASKSGSLFDWPNC